MWNADRSRRASASRVGGVLGALGRLLGRGRPLGGELGFLAERAREHARDQRDDRRHPHAERHGRTDEVIARELLRQVHLPGDLRDEQDRERRERPQDAVAHRSFDRQEVGHHPGRVGRFGRRDPHPLQDHDRVQQERHGSDPVQVRRPSGLLDELREEQVAEEHPDGEDQAQLEGVGRRVRVDALDEGLDEAVGDEQPSDLDEPKLESLGLLEISPHRRSIPRGRLESRRERYRPAHRSTLRIHVRHPN